MRLFILSQCRDLRTGVMKEDFGVLVTQHEQESSGCSGVFLSETAVISGLIDLTLVETEFFVIGGAVYNITLKNKDWA